MLRLILTNATLPMNLERPCVLLFSTSLKVLSLEHDFTQFGTLLEVIISRTK